MKTMHKYVVVYKVYGIHYRFRTYNYSKKHAIKECIECMLVKKEDIVEAYRE